jgi:predicted RND superfamily exporter protein
VGTHWSGAQSACATSGGLVLVWGIGFGAERIGLVALKFPRIASICLFALLVLVGTSLSRLSFDDDIHRVFLSDSPLSQAQRTYEAEQSPPLSTALIHVTSPEVLNAQDMTALRDLSLDLEFVDGVTAVASPFILRWPPSVEAPSGTPLFGTQIGSTFANDLASFEALETGLPTFVNDTLKAILLSVSINTDQTTIAAAMFSIQAELDRALPAGFSANITGEDIISAEIVSGLKDDLIALNLWGSLIITFAAFALLRDLRMALLAVVPAIIGAAGVLALSVWLGYPITVLSNVIPILLLVLGVADGVHLTAHLKENGTLRGTIENVGPACALTALTTAVAFASIMLTGNAQLFEFAVLGAVGTMLSFALVIVTFALLGRIVPLSDKPIPQISAVFAQRLTRIGAARPRATITACMLILGVATLGFSQTKAWFPLYQNLPDDSATLATNDAISDDFGGVFQVVAETNGDWTQTRDLVAQLEAVSPAKTVLSEVNFARWLGHPDAPPTAKELETLPKALVDQLRSGYDTARIFVSVPEPMRSDDTLTQFDLIYDTALTAGAGTVMGLPTVMRQEAVNLIGQLSFGLIIAALGATLLVAIAFRSARLVPVLIIPNILPLMITGASLHLWAQGQLTPTSVLALTIAFGIAIDDTVHFLSRFSDARAHGQTSAQAVASATKSAGQVMVLTTLLLTVGLSVTLFSDFAPIRLFGGMMIVTLWAALLIDLLLLPALLTSKRTAHVSV